MADTEKSAPRTKRPLPNVAIQHRLNHIGYGNLGRVSYSPVDNDHQPAGRLQTSRSVDSNQHSRLISHFTELLLPTRSALPEDLTGKKPSDAARLQKNWLLENHPEAIGGGGIDGLALTDELKTLKVAEVEDATAATSSLLAVGEIIDRTDVHAGTVGQPAIAMAAGEGGHVLRIVPLDQENAARLSKELSVQMVKVSPGARGDWGEDGVPITLIKFAIDGRPYDPIRWLLAQRPTGTTLFEPEIKVVPFQRATSEYEQSHLYSQMPRYIAANPLFTIDAKKTGGRAHVDACFNPAVDGRFPQLAIIDDVGQWTVWDITGSRSAVPKLLEPIVTARGSIDISPVPSLQIKLGKDSAAHKLLYVLPKGERRVKREGEQEDADPQHWGWYSRSPVRCNHLLACSDTDVRLYDASQGTQLAGIRVVNAIRGEGIVDMQSCPFSPSQACVLTTSALYWIDTEVARDGQGRISVICSFPHHRWAEAGGLTMSVSPLPSSAGPQSCAVFVVSAQGKAADLFILTQPTLEEMAHAVHQVVRADLPSPIRSIFTAARPVGRNGRTNRKAIESGASVADPDSQRLFQLFGLKSDLSLGTTLLLTSDQPLQAWEAPSPIHEARQSDKLRKKFLRLVGNAFVVPDNSEDRLETAHSDTESTRQRQYPDRKPTKRREIIDLQAACERLDELAVDAIAPAKMSRQLLAGVIHRRGMEELGDSDYMRVRTLSELVGDKLSACDLDTLEEEWTEFRGELHSAYEGKVQVSDLGGLTLPRDLQSLTWQLSALSYVNEDTPDSAKEKQRHLLRHLAGKQYLSLFGISVAPPPTIPPTEAEDATPQPSSQMTDEDSFLPSSPTPSGTQSHHSRDIMDIDSGPLPPQPPDQGPLSRLRKYIDIPTTPTTIPLSKPSPARLLSHWPPSHSDPWSFTWEEDEGPLTAEDEEAMQKRKRREEARTRRRSARQRLSMGLPVEEDDDASGAGAGARPVFGTPRVAMSSQPRGLVESGPSQSQSLGLTPRPRISMSQVMPGQYGGRPGTGKKKARKSVFR